MGDVERGILGQKTPHGLARSGIGSCFGTRPSQDIVDGGLGGFGHQAQRVAGEIEIGLAVGVQREVKLLAEVGQGV
ncbi:MAG TPA: hypothetical protein RMF84_14725, partial [Polyangiaceae bacterium LLY-WYZ-14_1]|nr:hypothetical protein [Polyangiaceae bacterium LLY-WYZ-14_1]